MNDTKICSGPCGRELPATKEYFSKNKNNPDGFQYICKICQRNIMKEYRSKNSEKIRLYNKKYREEHKDLIIQIRRRNYLHLKELGKEEHKERKRKVISHYGGVCQCCGESNPIFLTIDHINNDGAEHRKDIMGRNSGAGTYQWLIKHDFPPGFQVLCWNCNLGKHINGGVCPHKELK